MTHADIHLGLVFDRPQREYPSITCIDPSSPFSGVSFTSNNGSNFCLRVGDRLISIEDCEIDYSQPNCLRKALSKALKASTKMSGNAHALKLIVKRQMPTPARIQKNKLDTVLKKILEREQRDKYGAPSTCQRGAAPAGRHRRTGHTGL